MSASRCGCSAQQSALMAFDGPTRFSKTAAQVHCLPELVAQTIAQGRERCSLWGRLALASHERVLARADVRGIQT